MNINMIWAELRALPAGIPRNGGAWSGTQLVPRDVIGHPAGTQNGSRVTCAGRYTRDALLQVCLSCIYATMG